MAILMTIVLLMLEPNMIRKYIKIPVVISHILIMTIALEFAFTNPSYYTSLKFGFLQNLV